MNAITFTAIVVPVHDEESVLGACLSSIGDACRRLPHEVDALVVVVLDACADASAAVAREALDGIPAMLVETHARSVGEARALGVRSALARAGGDPSRIWIASTDADTRVPADWLVAQCALAEAGAVGVAGVVHVDDWRALPRHRALAYEAWYRRSTGHDDAHDHVHGANLGVRADAYVRAGGFPAQRTGEDQALWESLRAQGNPLVATRRIAVTTSARLEARAPRGFADFLRRHVLQGERMPGEGEDAVA